VGVGLAQTGDARDKILRAPTVSQEQTRRPHEREAPGLVDAALIGAGGLALRTRSRSAVPVNDGMARCPRCATVFEVCRTHRGRREAGPARDPQRAAVRPTPAGGGPAAGARWESRRHRELHAGRAPPLRDDADRYPGATPSGRACS
jgi:hypothetical protein